MSQLIFEILQEDDPWEPEFAMQSALNWMRALAYEIRAQHGATDLNHLESCRAHFNGKMTPKTPSRSDLAAAYGPLYHSLAIATSLTSMEVRKCDTPWTYTGGIISWYYAHYHAFRSVMPSMGGSRIETHAALSHQMTANGLYSKLPHPLNMEAQRVKNEEYGLSFPDHPKATKFDLSKKFPDTREAAQGMLLQYLGGTAAYHADETKATLKTRLKLGHFRGKDARAARDAALKPIISYFHCAYRYRGKANYRDAIFLSYGQMDARFDGSFVRDLATAARFAFTCAFALLEARYGAAPMKDFIADARDNFRGLEVASAEVAFWTSFS